MHIELKSDNVLLMIHGAIVSFRGFDPLMMAFAYLTDV